MILRNRNTIFWLQIFIFKTLLRKLRNLNKSCLLKHLNKKKFRGLEVIITSVLAINYPWSSSVFHVTQESNIVKPIVDVPCKVFKFRINVTEDLVLSLSHLWSQIGVEKKSITFRSILRRAVFIRRNGVKFLQSSWTVHKYSYEYFKNSHVIAAAGTRIRLLAYDILSKRHFIRESA